MNMGHARHSQSVGARHLCDLARKARGRVTLAACQQRIKKRGQTMRAIALLTFALCFGSKESLGVLGFGEPELLNTNAATDFRHDLRPHLVTDGAGNWVVVWWTHSIVGSTIGTDEDILVSRSSDNGETWTPPVALDGSAAPDPPKDLYPAVATDGAGSWVAVWHSWDGSENDIVVCRSTDNAVTWGSPVPLGAHMGFPGQWPYHRHPELATDGAGNWVIVWASDDSLDETIGTDKDIFISRSADNGATWTSPAPLNDAATDTGDDWHPTVVTDGMGNWLVVWDSQDAVEPGIGGDDDIIMSRSTDNGYTWTAPAALNSNAKADREPDWHPHVTTDRSGHWVAVWDVDYLGPGFRRYAVDVFVSRSMDNGATWSPPIALNAHPGDYEWQNASPRVTTDGKGNWLAVWSSNDDLDGAIGLDMDILVCRSTDNGATWTYPAPLDTNAATDSGESVEPQVATDCAGMWLAVWSSRPAGLDSDLMISVSAFNWDEDTDGDGIVNIDEGDDDADGDGIPNYLDTDSDDDGIPDADEGTDDRDGDGIANYLDTDSDGDGIPDADEGAGDPDADGIPNYLDSDSDGDHVSDAMEMACGTDPFDSNSVPELPTLNHARLLILVLCLLVAGWSCAGIYGKSGRMISRN
jgi:hypothetical protein